LSDFSLHPQIAADTAIICNWPLCRVLLMNDARFPWLILVPRRTDTIELIDLTAQDRTALMGEIARASRFLKSWAETRGGCDKLNVAMIGNLAPQLHIHVVARRRTDSLWPQTVWGRGEPVRYAADELASSVTELARLVAG
jgi:diadenosine tetraphosphate (Ap4A) HIT family hydrolase